MNKRKKNVDGSKIKLCLFGICCTVLTKIKFFAELRKDIFLKYGTNIR